MVIELLTFSPLELCDLGDYRGAGELLGLTAGQRPERGVAGDSEHAEALLVAGIISSVAGGILQAGNQGAARAMLTEAASLLGDDPKSHAARSWLAWVEYWDGDLDKALALIQQVTNSRADNATRFRALLLRAGIYSDQGIPDQAFTVLTGMVSLYDSCSPLLKGKFHNQRGRVLRLLEQTDRAIVDYDAAFHFFEQVGDRRCQAFAANNLAGIYLETEQFAQAHECAEQARLLFRELGDKSYEAATWDQTASIFLAEGKTDTALCAIDQGITLVAFGGILTECLATRDRIIKNILDTKDEINRDSIADGVHSVSPTPSAVLPSSERGARMSPFDNAVSLLAGNPSNAVALLDLLIWSTSDRDEPKHEAQLDEVERMLFSHIPECEESRERYRQRRLIHEAI